MRAAYPSLPPSHTLPLYATIPLPMADDGSPSSKQQSIDLPQALPPWLTLPTPPPSPPLSGAPPLSYGNPVRTMPTNATLSDSHSVYLHPILESTLLLRPHMAYEPRKALPADVNNHLSEPATNPGLGYLTIILHPSGRHVPVQPSAIGRGIVRLGDVLHVLRELSAALLEERSHKTQKNANRGPGRKGLWTWMVDGKPVAGYLTIGVEDVVWPRR